MNRYKLVENEIQSAGKEQGKKYVKGRKGVKDRIFMDEKQELREH